jgi:hypothetical protein
VIGFRVDGAPRTTQPRDVIYCDDGRCAPPVTEAWRIGGISYGLELGVRLTIR